MWTNADGRGRTGRTWTDEMDATDGTYVDGRVLNFVGRKYWWGNLGQWENAEVIHNDLDCLCDKKERITIQAINYKHFHQDMMKYRSRKLRRAVLHVQDPTWMLCSVSCWRLVAYDLELVERVWVRFGNYFGVESMSLGRFWELSIKPHASKIHQK